MKTDTCPDVRPVSHCHQNQVIKGVYFEELVLHPNEFVRIRENFIRSHEHSVLSDDPKIILKKRNEDKLNEYRFSTVEHKLTEAYHAKITHQEVSKYSNRENSCSYICYLEDRYLYKKNSLLYGKAICS